MRFVHIADTHLGMVPDKGSSWSDMRAKELWDTFGDIIAHCRETQPDLLLVAGDLFHKQPLLKEIKADNREFESIPSTRVVIIAGNHDYISGNSFYRRFEWAENVHFIGSGEIERVYFDDIDTEVYGCSYLNREYREAVFDGLKPEFTDRINILLGHGGDEGNIPIDWKGLSRAGFDYVALGHIHKPQDMAENIRYSGSPEPLDKNETGKHGFIEGFITSAGEKAVSRRIDCARRQYVKAEIKLVPEDTLLTLRRKVSGLIAESGESNIYCFKLTGERSPDESFDYEGISDLGYILELTDESVPKLDLDELAAENADNVIGYFIESLRSKEKQDPLKEKALLMGVMALTGREL